MLLSDIQPNLDLELSKQHYFTSGDVADLQSALARPSDTYAVDPKHFEARFNWSTIAADTRQLYHAVAGR